MEKLDNYLIGLLQDLVDTGAKKGIPTHSIFQQFCIAWVVMTFTSLFSDAAKHFVYNVNPASISCTS